MTGIARVYHEQQVHYLRKRINFGDAGIAAGVVVGTLPAGALISAIMVRVNTAFNAGTTNPITIGTNSSTYNNLVASATITSATPGGYAGVPATFGAVTFAADTDVLVTYIPTGTAATTGQADILVQYAPNNDG